MLSLSLIDCKFRARSAQGLMCLLYLALYLAKQEFPLHGGHRTAATLYRPRDQCFIKDAVPGRRAERHLDVEK